VEIIADSVQFLGGRGEGGEGQPQFVPAGAAQQAENADFGAADDDIPF
jgi:single-stranded DNA-binding protein